MRRPLLIAALVVCALAAGAGDASAALTIRINDEGWITRIGDLKTRAVPPTFERATQVFGRATEVAPVGNGGDACRITWGALKLRALFANFGGGRACAPTEGMLQSATIRGRKFRTWRGLRVGDPSSSIKEKHPGAVFRRNVWWIASAENPYGEEATRLPTVEALVSGGRVTILRLWVGGAGD